MRQVEVLHTKRYRGTSLASRGADLLVDRRCPAQYYILGCDFLTHAPANERETRLFFHFVEGYDRYNDYRYNDWKKYKNGRNLSGKNKNKKASSPFVCT